MSSSLRNASHVSPRSELSMLVTCGARGLLCEPQREGVSLASGPGIMFDLNI